MKPKLTFLLALTILLLSIATSVLAGSKSIILVCNYQYSIDDSGQSSPTSGSNTFRITFLTNTDIVVKSSGLGALMRGTQSKEQFNATAFWDLQGNKQRTSISINRYSGVLEEFNGSAESNKGLIHYGQCLKKEKLF